MTFGQKLKSIRERDGVTQRSLAEYLEMDAAYLSRIENDVRNHLPNVDTIQKIVDGFDLTRADADELFVLANKLPPDVMRGLLSRPRVLPMVRRMLKAKG